jgi:hypothetical protein
MTEPITNFAAAQALTLLTGYGFELKGYSASILIYKWLNHYQAHWVRLAVVEALYQGRYKAISVEHILDCWRRRGQPNFHFSLEFERLICQNLVTSVTPSHNSPKNPPIQPSVTVPQVPPQTAATANLPNLAEESASLAELPEASIPVVTIVEPESVIAEALINPLEIVDQVTENRVTIQQFTPLLDDSQLYVKLRAVAHQQLNSQQPVS